MLSVQELQTAIEPLKLSYVAEKSGVNYQVLSRFVRTNRVTAHNQWLLSNFIVEFYKGGIKK